MGKLLDIRVTAQTYNEEDVAKTWPRLSALVWPQWFSKLGLDRVVKDLPGYSIGLGAVEKSLGARKHGVVELAEALPDLIKFSELPEAVKQALQEPVQEITKINADLAAALGDWDAKKASSLSYALEEALSQAEQNLSKL